MTVLKTNRKMPRLHVVKRKLNVINKDESIKKTNHEKIYKKVKKIKSQLKGVERDTPSRRMLVAALLSACHQVENQKNEDSNKDNYSIAITILPRQQVTRT